MNETWLLVDTNTGIVHGYYRQLRYAKVRRTQLKKDYGNLRILKVIQAQDIEHCGIYDFSEECEYPE